MLPKLTIETSAENPIAHDLHVEHGQGVMIGLEITDAEDYSAEVTQRVLCRLLMVRGEWYMDQLRGTPWRERVWGKAGVVNGSIAIEKMIKGVILETPGIASVESVAVSLDRSAHRCSITAEATTDTTAPVSVAALDLPFVVAI